MKVLRVHDSKIEILTTAGDFLVTGGAEGFVRLFDHQMRLMGWFEDFKAGAISSISFARKKVAKSDSPLALPHFVVATRKGIVLSVNPKIAEEPDPKRREGKAILHATDGQVLGAASHPHKNRLTMASSSGLVQTWEFSDGGCTLHKYRKLEKTHGTCVAYDPKGVYLAIGSSNGTIRFLSASSLKDVNKGNFRNGKAGVTLICFSKDSNYFAAADQDNCVSLFKFTGEGRKIETNRSSSSVSDAIGTFSNFDQLRYFR